MAKILIFIDHDIIVRHFLNSGVLRNLEEFHEVVYVFPENQKRRLSVDPTSLGLRHYKTLPIESSRTYLWKRLYHAASINRARRSQDRKMFYRLLRESLGWKPFLKSWFWSLPLVHALYKAFVIRKIGPNHTLDRFLNEEKMDVIIHPTVLAGLFVSDLIQWRQTHQTPVLFLMNSWDNPSLKAMVMGSPDALVVWGEQTMEQAHHHMGIPKDRLYSFGAAQFDIYRKPPTLSREKLIEDLGLSASRKTLLYAGSSKGMNEVSHLQLLEKAIDEGRLRDCQIIFRPHPWRGIVKGEADFFSIPWKHITMDPEMVDYYKRSRVVELMVYLPDYAYTHSLLSAIDALVSPVSTILLEAALHGKPILAYMPESEIANNTFVRTMANMNFMKDFYDRFDCGPCLSSDNFINDCNILLDMVDRPGIAEQIKQKTAFFISPSSRSYGESLVELVNHSIN